MHAFGQVMESGDAGLGAAATGTEEVPAHDEDASVGCGEEQLNDVVGGGPPAACELQRTHAAERNGRGAIEVSNEIRREAVRSGIGGEVDGERVEPRAGFRFDEIRFDQAGFAFGLTVSDQALDSV